MRLAKRQLHPVSDASARALTDRIPAEIAVYQLMGRLFYYVDTFNYAPVAEMFCADGVWTRLGIDYKGPEAILDTLEKRGRARVIQHVITNLFVEDRRGDEARFRGYLVPYIKDHCEIAGKAGPLQAAHAVGYCNGAIRWEGDAWRFLSLETVARFLEPHS
jgi:SnoaL-like domain